MKLNSRNLSIIGNGQLASVFENSNLKDACIFASGVSNSNCNDPREFEREKNLLQASLKEHKAKRFIYFSSCALSASEYQKNLYYKHKQSMEELIENYSESYYIFRIPQLFGNMKEHKTLINFLYNSILSGSKFVVYNTAYRYVIEIEDLKHIVEAYIKHYAPCITLDIANSNRYRVLDIVHIFEKLLDKNAKYDLIEKEDKYTLNLLEHEKFVLKYTPHISYGKSYLKDKLVEKLCTNHPIKNNLNK